MPWFRSRALNSDGFLALLPDPVSCLLSGPTQAPPAPWSLPGLLASLATLTASFFASPFHLATTPSTPLHTPRALGTWIPLSWIDSFALVFWFVYCSIFLNQTWGYVGVKHFSCLTVTPLMGRASYWMPLVNAFWQKYVYSCTRILIAADFRNEGWFCWESWASFSHTSWKVKT